MRFDYDTRYADSLALLRYPPARIAYALLAIVLLAVPWLMPKYVVGELGCMGDGPVPEGAIGQIEVSAGGQPERTSWCY